MNYDKNSFLAGLALGKQMKGWSAYGVVTGWNPDGDLIIRPIKQGVKDVDFDLFDLNFEIDNNIEDIVIAAFTDQENHGLTDEINMVVWESSSFNFGIDSLTERISLEQVVHSFTINGRSEDLLYNEDWVQLQYSWSNVLKLKTSWTFTSTAQTIDDGNLQLLQVDTSPYSEITSQGITSYVT